MKAAMGVLGVAAVAAVVAGGSLAPVLLAGCRQQPAVTAAASATGPGTAATSPSAAKPAAAEARSQGGVPPAPARATALAAASAAWPKVTGHWLRGDTDARFTAWFEGGELRYLEEVAVRRRGAPLHRRYYFEHGALFYYSGESPAGAAVGGGATAMAQSVPVIAEFDGAQPRQAVRIEHYGEVPLDAAAVIELQRRAAALAGLALNEWSAAGPR